MLIFITGGARSGKSKFAETVAARMGRQVLYVATGVITDEEMKARVEFHRKRRPAEWRVIEEPLQPSQAIKTFQGSYNAVLIDCLTFLINNILHENTKCSPEFNFNVCVDSPGSTVAIQEVRSLVELAESSDKPFIVVSNEVGMGVVPEHPLGRAYRDLLGVANQIVAERATEVYFMVSGIPLRLK